MSIGQTFETDHQFIHSRVVLHGARTQRIHAEIDSVVPGGKPGEVADDFDFADFGHVAQVFSFRWSEQRRRVHVRNVEGGQLPRRLSWRRLLEYQALVLIDVPGGLTGHVFHRATSCASTSSLADLTDRSLSATSPTA